MGGEQQENQNDVDLAAALGAGDDVLSQCFSIYVPNKDQHNREIGNQRQWVLEVLRLLSEINGGATAMPPAEGGWLSTTADMIWENPVIVYSFVQPDQFIANLPRIRSLLHRMGRETNQGEVAFEFDNQFYRIRTFDSAESKVKP